MPPLGYRLTSLPPLRPLPSLFQSESFFFFLCGGKPLVVPFCFPLFPFVPSVIIYPKFCPGAFLYAFFPPGFFYDFGEITNYLFLLLNFVVEPLRPFR